MVAHLLILYPSPRDTAEFDRLYREEHLPYAGARLRGATGVATKRVIRSASLSPYHLISDISFPTVVAMEECIASSAAQEALAHAVSISSGGRPTVLAVIDDDENIREDATELRTSPQKQS